MSRPHQPQLPPELLDYIVDHLHDSTEDLHSCCLISKSWIPRIRSRIFACVKFYKESLESWESTFPDPSTSPASYTKSLLICCDTVVIGGNAEEGGWISSFSSVVRLDIMGLRLSSSPVSLHGFSPVLKSLNLCRSSIWPSQILNLICSFPLLEDVTVESFGGPSKDDGFDGQPDLIPPRGSPALTGSLDLYMCEGIGSISSGLLSLPSGLHFRKLVLALHHEEDVPLVTALVDGCCSTLEFLKVDCSALGTCVHHLDLCQLSNYGRRPINDRPNQPPQSNGTQTRGAGIRLETTMGCHCAPNHHKRSQSTPTDHTFHTPTSVPPHPF